VTLCRSARHQFVETASIATRTVEWQHCCWTLHGTEAVVAVLSPIISEVDKWMDWRTYGRLTRRALFTPRGNTYSQAHKQWIRRYSVRVRVGSQNRWFTAGQIRSIVLLKCERFSSCDAATVAVVCVRTREKIQVKVSKFRSTLWLVIEVRRLQNILSTAVAIHQSPVFMHRNCLAAELCPDPLEELTPLPQTS